MSVKVGLGTKDVSKETKEIIALKTKINDLENELKAKEDIKVQLEEANSNNAKLLEELNRISEEKTKLTEELEKEKEAVKKLTEELKKQK